MRIKDDLGLLNICSENVNRAYIGLPIITPGVLDSIGHTNK